MCYMCVKFELDESVHKCARAFKPTGGQKKVAIIEQKVKRVLLFSSLIKQMITFIRGKCSKLMAQITSSMTN
jgi:hypothetical protein